MMTSVGSRVNAWACPPRIRRTNCPTASRPSNTGVDPFSTRLTVAIETPAWRGCSSCKRFLKEITYYQYFTKG